MFSFGGNNGGSNNNNANNNSGGGNQAGSGGGFGGGFGAASGFGAAGSSGFGRAASGGFGANTGGAGGFGKSSAPGGFGGNSGAGSGFGKSSAPGGGFGGSSNTGGFGKSTGSGGFGQSSNTGGFGKSSSSLSSSSANSTGGFGAATKGGFGNVSGGASGNQGFGSSGGNNASSSGFGFGNNRAGKKDSANRGFGAGFGGKKRAGEADKKPGFGSGGFGAGQSNQSSPASGGGFGRSSGQGFGQASSPAGFGNRAGFGSGGGAATATAKSGPSANRPSQGFGRASGFGSAATVSSSPSAGGAKSKGSGKVAHAKNSGAFGGNNNNAQSSSSGGSGFGAGAFGGARAGSPASSGAAPAGTFGFGSKSQTSSGGFGNRAQASGFGQGANASSGADDTTSDTRAAGGGFAGFGAATSGFGSSSGFGSGNAVGPGGFGNGQKPKGFGKASTTATSSGFGGASRDSGSAFKGSSFNESSFGSGFGSSQGEQDQQSQQKEQDGSGRGRRKREADQDTSSRSGKTPARKEVQLSLRGAPTDEDALFEYFSKFGPVETVQVRANQSTAQIVFGNIATASKVVRKAMHKIGGTSVKARFGGSGVGPKAGPSSASASSNNDDGAGGASASAGNRSKAATSANSEKIAEISREDKARRKAMMEARIAELERQKKAREQKKQQGSQAPGPATNLASLDPKMKKRTQQSQPASRKLSSAGRAISSSFSAVSSDGAEDEREDDDDDDDDDDSRGDGGSDANFARRKRAERFKLARPVSSTPHMSADPTQPPIMGATPREKGKFLVGECMKMCPKSETDRRYHENSLHLLERQHPEMPELPSKYELTVKSFMRSSAGMVLDIPDIVRPESVLARTIDYLWDDILDRPERGADPRFRDSDLYRAGDGATPTPAFVISFLQDRTRSVRKDFSLQGFLEENGPLSANCVRVFEECARMHIMVDEQLCNVSKAEGHDETLNRQEANNCLKALNGMYARARALSPSSSQQESQKAHILRREAEFRAYYILMQASDAFTVAVYIRDLPSALRQTTWLRIALQVTRALHRRDFVTFFRLLRSPQTPYLVGCLMHGLLERVWRDALFILNHATSRQGDAHYSFEKIAEMLCFEDADHARAFTKYVGLPSQDNLHIEFGKVRTLARPDTRFPRRVLKLVEDKRFNGTPQAEYPPRRQIVRGLDVSHQRLNDADDQKASSSSSSFSSSSSSSFSSSHFSAKTPVASTSSFATFPASTGSFAQSGTNASNATASPFSSSASSSTAPPKKELGSLATPAPALQSNSASAFGTASQLANSGSEHEDSKTTRSAPVVGGPPGSNSQQPSAFGSFSVAQKIHASNDSSSSPALKRQNSSFQLQQPPTLEQVPASDSPAVNTTRDTFQEEQEKQQQEQRQEQAKNARLAEERTRERLRAQAAAQEAERVRLAKEEKEAAERARQEREAQAAREAALRAKLQAEEQERMRKEAEEAARAQAEAKRQLQRGREQHERVRMSSEDRHSRQVEKQFKNLIAARRERLTPVFEAWTRFTRLSTAAKARVRTFRASLAPFLGDGVFAPAPRPQKALQSFTALGAPPFAPKKRSLPHGLDVSALVQMIASATPEQADFLTWKLCVLSATSHDAGGATAASWIRARLCGPGHMHGTSTLASFQMVASEADSRRVHVAIKACGLDEPEISESQGADALCVIVPHPLSHGPFEWDEIRSAISRASRLAQKDCTVCAVVVPEAANRVTHKVSSADREQVCELLGLDSPVAVQSLCCPSDRLLDNPNLLTAGDLDALLRWLVREAPAIFPRIDAMLQAQPFIEAWQQEVALQEYGLSAAEIEVCSENVALAPQALKCWFASVLLGAFEGSEALDMAEKLFAEYNLPEEASAQEHEENCFWRAHAIETVLAEMCTEKKGVASNVVHCFAVRDIVRVEDISYPSAHLTSPEDDPWIVARDAAAQWTTAFNDHLRESIVPRIRATENATWPAPEFTNAFGLPTDWNDSSTIEAACEAVTRCCLAPPTPARTEPTTETETSPKVDLVQFVQDNAIEPIPDEQIVAFVENAIGASVLSNLNLLLPEEIAFVWQLLIDHVIDNKRGQPEGETLVFEVSCTGAVPSSSSSSSILLRKTRPERLERIEPTPKRTRRSPRDLVLRQAGELSRTDDESMDVVPAIVDTLVHPIQAMAGNLRSEWTLKDKFLAELAEEGEDFMRVDFAQF